MNEFHCENFLAVCDPNQTGYRQWRNFLRQWYVHGPYPMPPSVRSLADSERWDNVLDAEAVAGEADLKPNLQPIIDPTTMTKEGIWMRWEAYAAKDQGWDFWCHPERVIARRMVHAWYLPRTKNYPHCMLPPPGIHLPIEFYTPQDILMPWWEEGIVGTQAHCPRCNNALEGQPDRCPKCDQRLGDYSSYSARDWPRKAHWMSRPPMPDDYSFYFLAAYVHAPASMPRLDLWTGSDCRYQAWLNGERIGRYVGPQRTARWDQDQHPGLKMKDGWNLLLVKLAHATWTKDQAVFLARFTLSDRRPIFVNNFAGETLAQEQQLKITVSEAIPIGVGRSLPNLRRFPDGTLVCNDRLSRDAGKTWQPCPNINAFDEIKEHDYAAPETWDKNQDPATLILGATCTEMEPGRYQGRLCRSVDGWRSRQFLKTTIHIPEGTNLINEMNIAAGPGTIMGLNIVRLPNGDLLAPMYGSLKPDVVWFDERYFGGFLKYPQQWPKQFKYRAWVLCSRDGGRTWDDRSTIAAFPELGDEGFAEPNIMLRSDGTLLAVLRNGGAADRPLWFARSHDGGQTWSCPVRTTLTGNYPSILELANGVLACMYGRPDNRISFDLTGTGLAWSHTVVLFNGRSNDHVEAAEIAPGELLAVFEDEEYDAQGRRLPVGQRQWYATRIKVERLTPKSP